MEHCRIRNTSKNTIVSEHATCCHSAWRKAVGLMFSSQKDLLFIEKKQKLIPLHMLFVFYPIDVLFLDNECKVVDSKENFLPFTFYTPNKKAQYILELKQGAIKASGTTLTDSLEFQL